jgi:Arylsulfotransferase (ASST)
MARGQSNVGGGSLLERLMAGAFIAALCGLAFAYGLAVMKYKLFPYRVLTEAQAAFDAWRQIDDDAFPPGVISWSKLPPDRLARTIDRGAGDEAVLITGGFYSRLDLCPKFGCLAVIVDRSGRPLHRWPAPDPARFFAEAKGHSGAVKPINYRVFGIALAPDGSLIVSFHGKDMFPYQVGIAKFDVNGRPLWTRFGENHHFPTLGADGRIYAPSVRLAGKTQTHFAHTAVDLACRTGGASYMEGVQVLDPDGRLIHDFPMETALAAAGYPGLFYSIRDGCDPFHINNVELLNAAAAERWGGNIGDLLVSVREASALVVMDKDTGAAKRVISGRTAGQHSPHFLPNGAILVFDNQGGDRALGGSRVAQILPEGSASTVFPVHREPGFTPFYSQYQGRIDTTDDGKRALVSSSAQGRIVEVDLATGKPLWAYEDVVDLAPFMQARGLKRAETFARVESYGAYYVRSLTFLRASNAKAPSIRPTRD